MRPYRRPRVKRDGNHALIAQAFEAHGWFVDDHAALGGGHPDLFVAENRCIEVEMEDGSVETLFAKSRFAYVEVKRDAKAAKRKGETAEKQAAWKERAERHGIPVIVVTSVEDVVRFVRGDGAAKEEV